MKKQYWTKQANDELLLCVISGTSHYDNCQHLQKSLNELIRMAVYSIGSNYDSSEDLLQDIRLHLLHKTIPRIELHRFKSGFQLLYVAARRRAINLLEYEQYRNTDSIDDVNPKELRVSSYESTDITDTNDTRKLIINELDKKIRQQRSINRVNSVFLILMKDYLVSNDYDPTGFKDYVMKKMGIRLSTYRTIISNLKIRAKVFNEKVIE